jgi:hypothetical protein
MNQVVAGISVSRVPPIGPAIPPGGVDPSLSVPTDLTVTRGGTVVVPVYIDSAHPDGSTGMVEAVLALTYDPQVFTVSAADVELGSLPAAAGGWNIHTVVNAKTGEIAIDLYSTNPIQTTAAGSLVNITMHAQGTAQAGSSAINVVNEVNPTGQQVYRTEAADGAGALVLHAVATSTGIEPGMAGQVVVAESLSTAATMLVTDAALGAQAVAMVQGPAEIGASAASAGNMLPMGLVEQVFNNLSETALVVEETAAVQPAPLFSLEGSEQAATGSQPWANLQAAAGQGRWDDCVTSLAQMAVRSRGTLTGDLQDDDATIAGDAAADLAGLDAFFTREGGR